MKRESMGIFIESIILRSKNVGREREAVVLIIEAGESHLAGLRDCTLGAERRQLACTAAHKT
jgi:hypothetical protein